MTASPILEVRGVTRRYRDRTVVDEASFQLQSGRIACLLGPSGCGKSTLLRLIAGLEPVDEGEIAIRGAVVSARHGMTAPEDRGVGLVFQDNALFPHLDVTDNVAFGLAGMKAAARRDRVAAVLSRFHVDHLARAWPHMLSGGEQQRVAIARALARNPSLLLLDEPFSGLDGHLRAQVRRSLLADLRDSGTTVLIVTHDPQEAMLIADELVLMSAGQILQIGSPGHCYRQPVSIAAARLIGDVLVLPARIAGGVAQTPLGPLPAPDFADGPAEAMIRPGMLRIADDGMAAEVVAVRCAGPVSVVDLLVGDHSISIPIAEPLPRPGARVRLAAGDGAIRIYPAHDELGLPEGCSQGL